MDTSTPAHEPAWRPDVLFSPTLLEWTAMVPTGAQVTHRATGYVGFGATREEAIADLMRQLPEGDRP